MRRAFAEVEEAAKVYQRIMTDIETKADGSEKDVNLKRHALHHILKMMKRHRTTGEFAESVWESMHARMNAAAYWQYLEQPPLQRQALLEHACAHMHGSAALQYQQHVGVLRDLQLAAWGWRAPGGGY